MDDTWITTEEAVKISGYHPIYLRTLLRDAKIDGRKFGRTWQVNKPSLLNYLQAAQAAADKRHGPKSNPNQ